MIEKFKDQRIAVLCGGPSSEREISFQSGHGVCEALRRKGYDAVEVDAVPGFLESLMEQDIRTAFVALHGKFGEDGTIQTLLERNGIFYTGSSPAGCAKAMDKAVSRTLFEKNGLCAGSWGCFGSAGEVQAAGISYPVFVKPVCGGSSIGVTRVEDAAALDAAVKTALAEDDRILVETAVAGREFAVGVLGGRALPPVEIIPKMGFFDFEAKYGKAGTRFEFAGDLSSGQIERLCDAALRAHRLLGCEVFSRVDLILGPEIEGRRTLHVLEVNAIPGLTSKSLLPKEAQQAGIAFDELCVMILNESALCREQTMIKTKEF